MFDPVYRYPASYAEEMNEMDAYRKSRKANIECKNLITEAINRNYRNNRLDSKAVAEEVLIQFSLERIAYVLANTIRMEDWDARYSSVNKAWAQTIPVCEDREGQHIVFNRRFIVNSHPGLVDLFTNHIRKLLDESKTAV